MLSCEEEYKDAFNYPFLHLVLDLLGSLGYLPSCGFDVGSLPAISSFYCRTAHDLP